MPLVSAINELKKARAGGYALPLFGLFEPGASEAFVDAARDRRAPVIAGIYFSTFDTPRARALIDTIRAMGERAEVSVSLMLDHGRDLDQCERALAWGFTDVMIDNSALPLDENIAATRRIVEAAHAVGAGVEAELGHVGWGDVYGEFGGRGHGFTDPAEVERFVAETSVDCLAIAIGTAHGVYHGEPTLDLDLLAEIRRRVEIPLVLHGGTGLSEAQFRAAIAAGISKINIATDLVHSMGTAMAAAATAAPVIAAVSGGNASAEIIAPVEPVSPWAIYESINRAAYDAMFERCCYYLDLLRASGKAG